MKAQDILCARQSDMPFSLGMEVIEVVGFADKPGHRQQNVLIVKEERQLVKTGTGRWYDKNTGRRAPYNQFGYRAIHSIGYAGTNPPASG